MSGYTPGPWWVHQHQHGWDVLTCRDTDWLTGAPAYVGSGTGAIITTVIGDHTEKRTRNSAEENARLIAAAPDLLEACRDAVDYYPTDAAPHYMAAIRSALAKATGAPR